MTSLFRALGLSLVLFVCSNPIWAQADTFRTDVAAHKVLGAMTLDEIEPSKGLRLFVEVADGIELDRIAVEFEELYREVEQRFVDRVGISGEHAEVRVVVTRSLDTWRALHGEASRPAQGGAVFDPTLGARGAVVTYDLAWPGSSRRVREVALHEALAQALVASRTADGNKVLPGALTGGLARIVGFDLERGVATHEQLIDVIVEGGFADGFFDDAETLFSSAGLNALWKVAQERTVETREQDFWAGERYNARLNEAAYILAIGLSNSAVHDQLLEWIQGCFDGATEDVAFIVGLETSTWGRLLSDELTGNVSFDPRAYSGTPAFQEAVASLPIPSAERTEPNEVGGAADCLAEGLWLASQGDLTQATLVLSSLPGNEQVKRHREWIEKIESLRASYLGHLADGALPLKLRIDYEGRMLSAEVTRIGRRSVFLGENNRDLDSVRIEDLLVGDLAERMGKESPAFGDPAARAWATALSGGKWKRCLTSALKKDEQLMGDLESVADQLERGRMLNLLWVADDHRTHGAQDRLDAIRELMVMLEELEEVREHKASLEDIAHKILGESFKGLDVSTMLAAKSVERDGDQLTMTYDFSSEEQLADWPMVEDYAPEFVKLFPELETKSPTFELTKKKQLLLQGSAAFQHLLTFGGPLKFTYELSYVKPKKKKEAAAFVYDYFSASICDDLAFQHLRTSQFGNIDIYAGEADLNVALRREEALTYKTGKFYTLEAELDADGKFTTRLDGEEIFSSESGDRGAGRLLFMMHSDRPMLLRSATIVGQLSSDQDEAKDLWIEAQMRALGL